MVPEGGRADDVVASVETTTVRMPLDPRLAVHGARTVHRESEFVLVRVRTRGGAYGYGEVSATPSWSGEDAASATHFVRDVIAPALVGQPLCPVRWLAGVADRAVAGNPFTKAGVETALWDALARVLEVPLTVLLGGPLRTEIPVKISLSGDGERLDRCHAVARERGFAAFKVKVGKGVDEDLRRVERARNLVGDGAFLGADANGGWTRAEAARAVAGLDDLGCAMVEQPLAPADLEGTRDLRGRGLPVLVDESVYGLADLLAVIRAGAADGASLYVGKSAGVAGVVASAAVAAEAGLDVVIGSNAEMGVGAAAMIHAAAACPRLSPLIPSDIIGHHFYADDVLDVPLDIDGRYARLPDGPGLGVELREDVVRGFR